MAAPGPPRARARTGTAAAPRRRWACGVPGSLSAVAALHARVTLLHTGYKQFLSTSWAATVLRVAALAAGAISSTGVPRSRATAAPADARRPRESVKADKDREYYLGASVKATVGRWCARPSSRVPQPARRLRRLTCSAPPQAEGARHFVVHQG